MRIKNAAGWGAVATSVFAMIIFAGCLIMAFLVSDQTQLGLLIGAAIANATTVVNFWLGSSSGSQKKDETIADAAAVGQAISGNAISENHQREPNIPNSGP